MCRSMLDIQSATAEIRRWKKEETRMWANAQRDGRPAEYRWRPMFSAAKFGWHGPTTRVPCSNAAKTRNPLKLAGVPQTNELISAASEPSSPYCKDMCGRHCCVTSFFLHVNACLSCEDIAWQSSTMVPRLEIFGEFLRPVFSASRVQHVSDLHL